MERIFCGDVRRFIPNIATFSFVRKKKKQTDKQRNKHKFKNRLSIQAGGGGANIFCLWSGFLLEMSENLSPIVHSFQQKSNFNFKSGDIFVQIPQR